MTADQDSIRKFTSAADNIDDLSKVKIARLLNTAAGMIKERQLQIVEGAVHYDLSVEFRRAAIEIDSVTSGDAAATLRKAAGILSMLTSPKAADK